MVNKSKQFILNISVFYTFIFFVFIAIPTYFYTNLELENYKIKQNKELIDHAQKIQRAIYDFSNSKSDTFIFPKSFKYHAQLNDKEGKLIYKTKNQNIKEESKVEIAVLLGNNRLNAKELIVFKYLSYKEIYLKISILSICVGLFIFLSIYLLIKASVEPYQKANEYLDAFFNDSLHELKTPLGVIQLNLEILDEKQPQIKEIERSINATKNLFLVYEDIEYLIKQKSVSYNKEMLDFSSLLSQRLDQFESLTHSKQLKLEAVITPSVKLYINRTHLQRIIDNTLSNTIKYSHKNTTIKIKLFIAEEQTVFEVHNKGEIIKDTKRIFERYYKENSIKGGFGIGLNIVKNICNENQIQILCTSDLEKGTTFKYIFKP
ncbi:MAG: sensor histidine kinase [Candidatus Marinarcus sp.]|uniref:sensor histidine kinase n=1 Tax=Candidatus Marinarcus sp. TaxID=3100987 RepID=UPI003AFFDFB1